MSTIEDRLAGETTAIPWIPDEEKAAKYGKDCITDNPIIGIAIGHYRRDNFRGDGKYDVLVLKLDDGRVVDVHCQATVLSNEMRDARPRAGEKVGIKFLGSRQGANQTYASYKVEVDREAGGDFNWGDASAPVFDNEPARTQPQAAQNDAERPPAPTDDDIPF